MTGVAFLTAGVVIYFLPVILGFQTLLSVTPGVYPEGPVGHENLLRAAWTPDPFTYMYAEVPQTLWAIGFMARGQLPLWNPHQGAGFPQMAELDIGLYNPIKLLFFLVFPGTTAFDAFAIFKIFFAALGAYLFLRSLSFSLWPSVAGSMAFAFSGYFRLFLTQWTTNTAMWAGWLLLAVHRIVFRGDQKAVALTGLVIGLLLLAGSPCEAVPLLFLGVAYLVFQSVQTRGRDLRRVGWDVIKFFGAVCIGGLLAAPMILDFLVLYQQGVHADVSPGAVWSSRGAMHLPLISSVSLLFSEAMFFGATTRGHRLLSEILPFAGIGTLILTLWAFGRDRQRNLLAVFFGVYCFLFISKIVGLFYIQWLAGLPGLSLIIWPKYTATLYFSLAVLAACGLENLLSGVYKLSAFFLLLMTASVWVFGNFAVGPSLFLDMFTLKLPDPEFIVSRLNGLPEVLRSAILALAHAIEYLNPYCLLLYAAAVAIGFGILTFALAWRGSERLAIVMCVALFSELVVYGPHLMPKRFDPAATPPYVSFLKQQNAANQGRVWGQGYFLMPSYASIYGLFDVRMIAAMFPERYFTFLTQTLFYVSGESKTTKQKMMSPYLYLVDQNGILSNEESTIAPEIYRYLDFLGVRYLIGRSVCPETLKRAYTTDYCSSSLLDLPESRFPLVYNAGGVKIYQNSQAFPRAYLVHNVIVAASKSKALSLLRDPSVDLRATAIVENAVTQLFQKPGKQSQAEILSYSPSRVVIRTSSEAAGLLVLTDSYYSGWRATVDGSETRIYPVNLAFRGVLIPEGRHEVVFSYCPIWVSVGMTASFGAAIILTSLLMLPRWRCPSFRGVPGEGFVDQPGPVRRDLVKRCVNGIRRRPPSA